MPTYNYYCKNCDKHFSYFQKMSELAILKCEKCRGKIDRIITGGSGLIFKGSGFYLTDYKNEKKSINDNKNNKQTIEKKDDHKHSENSTKNQSISKKVEKKNE